jgi:hypothetical protein
MECIRNYRIMRYHLGIRPDIKKANGRYCYDVSRSCSLLSNKVTTNNIAQSSTEAKFTNMADAGKAALYLQWILEEIGIIMDSPTPLLADNQGAVRLASAHQPTRRTRHVEMKHFIILQWTDDKFIDFVDTSTDENYSDYLSKPTGRTKFYEHTDVFMGRRKLAYTSYIDHSNTNAHRINYVCVSTYRSNPIISL